MALKFLNKKGWHTGSLRNIENVWKAEQKHEAEQKKLEELKKQIREERERAGFRQLQEEAGLISKQERLEFLYDSGLAVGKSSGFKALENLPKTEQEGAPSSSASAKDSAAPGALFEDKPQSSNDAWRKLHSDPLLLIRQREQEALARIKNNPVKMAMIRKSVESEKGKDKEEKKKRKKGDRKSSKRHRYSSPDNDSDSDSRDARRPEKRRDGHDEKSSHRPSRTSDDESTKKYREREYRTGRHGDYAKDEDRQKSKTRNDRDSHYGTSDKPPRYESRNTRRKPAQLSEEERAAKLREMQMDAELHEQHRWKLLKKAEDKDKQEEARDELTRGRNFLDAVEKSVYGTDKGGSLTIEESVRRRTHYSQGRSAAETNAFRRS